MKFGVVVFPGSNCDKDIFDALQYEMNQEVTELWHKDKDISGFNKTDCIILPGGFSYGDYLRCGAIAKFSPMMQSVIEFAHKGGKVLGICNGFQILCESGLLPGVLLRNANMQFVCKNIFITNEHDTKILYRYCDETGNINDADNPNGATLNIAGICNADRNIMGMMPHPERACSKVLHNEDGKKVLSSLFSIN